MKGLKKIALVTAIAAAPFAAQAEMTALNDSAMGNVTGQAGVTIELETQVSIGQFKYTDTDEGGSFNVNGIVLGGAGVTADGAAASYGSLLDQLKIDIDLNAEGDAVIHVGTLDSNPIDWGFTANSMTLEGTSGESTTLISNMSGWGNLARLDITVDTADKGTGDGSLNIQAAFDVQDMDFDVPFLAVGVQDMSITGAGYIDLNGDGANDFDLDGSGAIDTQAEQVAAGYANVDLSVYKGSGLGPAATAKADVLRVDVNNVVMDVNVGGVLIGGTSIGSVALDNLAITNTKLAVYGH